MLYSVLSILAPSKSLNPESGAIGLKIGLSFIPELIAMLGLVFVGLATLNLRRMVEEARGRGVQSSHEYRERRSKVERAV
jgi:protein-S-isoprenylcysteine O-methyltransferase Ste14